MRCHMRCIPLRCRAAPQRNAPHPMWTNLNALDLHVSGRVRCGAVTETLIATQATTAWWSASSTGSSTTRQSRCSTCVRWSCTTSTSVSRRSGTATSRCWTWPDSVHSASARCPSVYRPPTNHTPSSATPPAGVEILVRRESTVYQKGL